MSRIARRTFGLVSWSLALATLAACSEPPSSAPETTADAPAAGAGVTVFTGARLLVGDGTVIDNATFTVGPDNRFGLVGATAAVTVPAGATTVDLTGRTVMPAIVDTHTHLSRDRAGLTADLKHRAYFGVERRHELGPGQQATTLRDAPRGHSRARALSHGGPRLHGAGAGPQRDPVLDHDGRGRARRRARAGRARRRHHQGVGRRPYGSVPEARARALRRRHRRSARQRSAHHGARVLPRRCERARAPRHRRVRARRARAHRRRVRRDAQGTAELRASSRTCPIAASRRT